MRLEEQFQTQHDLVFTLRRTIYIRKIRLKIILMLLIMLSALFLYKAIAYSAPYLIKLVS